MTARSMVVAKKTLKKRELVDPEEEEKPRPLIYYKTNGAQHSSFNILFEIHEFLEAQPNCGYVSADFFRQVFDIDLVNPSNADFLRRIEQNPAIVVERIQGRGLQLRRDPPYGVTNKEALRNLIFGLPNGRLGLPASCLNGTYRGVHRDLNEMVEDGDLVAVPSTAHKDSDLVYFKNPHVQTASGLLRGLWDSVAIPDTDKEVQAYLIRNKLRRTEVYAERAARESSLRASTQAKEEQKMHEVKEQAKRARQEARLNKKMAGSRNAHLM